MGLIPVWMCVSLCVFVPEYIGMGWVLAQLALLESCLTYSKCCVRGCVCCREARGSSVGVTCSRREAEMSWLVACGSRADAVCGWLALNLAWLMRVESSSTHGAGTSRRSNTCSHTTSWEYRGKTEADTSSSLLLVWTNWQAFFLYLFCYFLLHKAYNSVFLLKDQVTVFHVFKHYYQLSVL